MTEEPRFGFEIIYKHEEYWVQGHLIEKYFWHTFGTQVENQDQPQVERKGLRADSKITHYDKFIV